MSSATSRLNAVALWAADPAPIEPEIMLGDASPFIDGPCVADVIDMYQIDPLSSFHKQRPAVRANHTALLRRIRQRHGRVPLSSITGRTLIEWHADWMGGTKVAMAHSFIAQLRTVFGFGFTLLADEQSERLSRILSKLKFQQAGARMERITADQAEAVRMWAHIIGWHSIGLGQALQFELILRQKDVIGEYVALHEEGHSNIEWLGQKWIRGLRWNQISDDLILRHTTSKKKKPIESDLELAPMVMDEFENYLEQIIEPDEPVMICEATGMPWSNSEYRRKWRIVARYAGVPDNVFNMDSRSGGISEAFEAGVNGERIQKTATHSDIRQTSKYNRGDQRLASDEVARGRASARRTFDGDVRDGRWHQAQSTPVQPISGSRSKRGAA